MHDWFKTRATFGKIHPQATNASLLPLKSSLGEVLREQNPSKLPPWRQTRIACNHLQFYPPSPSTAAAVQKSCLSKQTVSASVHCYCFSEIFLPVSLNAFIWWVSLVQRRSPNLSFAWKKPPLGCRGCCASQSLLKPIEICFTVDVVNTLIG